MEQYDHSHSTGIHHSSLAVARSHCLRHHIASVPDRAQALLAPFPNIHSFVDRKKGGDHYRWMIAYVFCLGFMEVVKLRLFVVWSFLVPGHSHRHHTQRSNRGCLRRHHILPLFRKMHPWRNR